MFSRVEEARNSSPPVAAQPFAGVLRGDVAGIKHPIPLVFLWQTSFLRAGLGKDAETTARQGGTMSSTLANLP